MGFRPACSSCGGIFDYDGKREKLEELDAATADSSLWDDAARAQAVTREQATIKHTLAELDAATMSVDDARTLYEMGREENDEPTLREAWGQIDAAEALVGKLEFRRMLSGTFDAKDAILSINAGAGGVDSQDWADMLLRMYSRWGERMGFTVKLMDVQEAEQAGIRSAELVFEGEYAYGYLRSEIGVHRLVRISPFDANARRQTSFASVMVVPDIGDETDIDIEVKESDLRVDKYRAGGKGGQHVNKTDSAVRLTHNPTGIVVACQAERSQHKNYDTAMRMLKARLWDLERQKREAKMAELRGEERSIEWGSQIRSYVLQPYRQVNDHRTGTKLGNVDAVLDGDLDALQQAYLLGQGKPNTPGDDDEA
ncbi:MAG: peptide chain release factor 2 [Deltaproteobacteria bacterium]|nr:peptide chain release factor 2 [Deltaproteobacteria bacterium]MBK8237484.1 peptide chain release factor 2 [Deltaproteobacteria bacterium]MBK8719925.1 peptide chain release factor 2 [Deltaproteobacteria bacterium]